MLVLSLDSAGPSCSACLWRDGTVLAHKAEAMERGQDQRLIPLILDVIKQADTSFDELDLIAVTRGPGSFTGLRIGLAAARGMGLAANKAVIGIDRFSIFHKQMQKAGKDLLVIIQSKRKELYCKFYPLNGTAEIPTMLTTEEILKFLKGKKDIIVTGDVPNEFFPYYVSAIEQEVVTCAVLASQATPGDTATLPRPLYIRAPDVTIKVPPEPKTCHVG